MTAKLKEPLTLTLVPANNLTRFVLEGLSGRTVVVRELVDERSETAIALVAYKGRRLSPEGAH